MSPERPTAPGPPPLRRFHREQSGQVTILFAFGLIGFVILFGFVLNTAQQTSRKVQMQNAVDSAAVVGATWVARGMNLIAFDNKGMADIVGVMIDVHAVSQAADAMPGLISLLAAPFFSNPFTVGIGIELIGEIGRFWVGFIAEATNLDQAVSGPDGIGWDLLSALDSLNTAITQATPIIALGDSAYYANANGLPGTIGAFLPDVMPVARGGRGRLALQANDCCLNLIEMPTAAVVTGLCFIAAFPGASCFLFPPAFMLAVSSNVSSLSGGNSIGQYYRYTQADLSQLTNKSGQTLQQILSSYNNQQSMKNPTHQPVTVSDLFRNIPGVALGILPLTWPDGAPEPMVLTDVGSPSDDVGDPPPPIDLMAVRQRLQSLAAARAPSTASGMVGGAVFFNPAPYGWITYAQGDVYNPTNWDMFEQNWRARLARATNLNANWQLLLSNLGSGLASALDSSFVNNH